MLEFIAENHRTDVLFMDIDWKGEPNGILLSKKLFDIRIQFGDLKKSEIDKLSKNLRDKYGKPTFTIKYSNDSWRDTWRTAAKNPDKQTILALNYSPQGGTVISYESVGR